MESLTDWERVDRLTDDEIAAAAADDPDTYLPDENWWKKAVHVPPDVRKTRVTLHLDEDVLAWFRRRGSGWQHSVNHALRRYMQDVERDRRQFEDQDNEPAAE